MTIKQYKITRAYKKMNELTQMKLPLTLSYKLWKLKKLLEPQIAFQSEKEQEIIAKYNPQVNGDGTLSFKNEKERNKFYQEMNETVNEISNMDIDLEDFEKVEFPMDDRIELTVDDIDDLSEFVDFVEEY